MKELKEEGVDFTQHLYVPEVDPVTGRARHDRSDHNHLLKRIAQHVRDGGYTAFDYEAFADVLADPLSGLTHAALVGKRRQNVSYPTMWYVHSRGLARMKRLHLFGLLHSGMKRLMGGV